MTYLGIVAGLALVVGLAVEFWRRGGPGTRLRFGRGNLYYTEGVTGDEGERVGRYLAWKGIFEAGVIDARLTRDGAVYQVQLICPRGDPAEGQDLACEVLAAGLSDAALAGDAVEVHICDRTFRPTSVVRHTGRFGRLIAENAASLFAMDGVEESEAAGVAAFLAEAGLFNASSKVAQINRAGEGYEFRLAVNVDPLTPDMVEGQRQMALDLSAQVLRGRPVDVRYTKGLAGTLRAQPPAAGPRSNGDPQRAEA